jgi:WD40 repeat protein
MLVTKIQIVTAGLLSAMLLGGGAGWLLNSGKPSPTAEVEQPLAQGNEPARRDLQGDLLPAGAVARLGTVRFRHGHGLQGLGFLADGKTLVGTGSDERLIHFWETSTGRLLREIDSGMLNMRASALSPDAKLIAVGGFLAPDGAVPTSGPIRIFDTVSGKEVRTLQRTIREVGHCSVGFTPDGKLLVSLGQNGVLRIEEVSSGVEILRQQFPPDYGHMAISPDGSIIAVATGPNTNKLYVWRWQTGEEPREWKVPRYRARELAFSPNGKNLAATSDHDSIVSVWDVGSGRLLHQLNPPEAEDYRLIGLAYSPDSKILAVSGYVSGYYSRQGWIGALHLWNAVTGEFRGRLSLDGGSAGRLAISPDSKWIAVATSNGVRVWDLAAKTELAANDEAHDGHLGRIAAATGGLVATASDDHTVRVWDNSTGRQRLKLTHRYWVRALAVSPDGTKLVSSSLDDTVRLWDLRTGRELYRLAGHGRLGGRRAVGFTPDGKRFLSWGDDYYLRVWDVANGKAVLEHRVGPPGFDGPEEDKDIRGEKLLQISDAVFSADGRAFALGVGRDVFFFDVESGKKTRTVSAETTLDRFALCPDGKLLLANCRGKPIQTKLADGTVQHSVADEHPLGLWDVATGKQVRQVMLPGSGWLPVAFSADGKTYAAALDKTIRLWDTASGEERPSITGFHGRVTALAFSADGRQLVSGLDDSSALIWDLKGDFASAGRQDR